jgi:small membrane protein
MIIQIFLSVLLFGVAVPIAMQRSSRLLKTLVLSVVAAGAFLVWVPEMTDRFAAIFGVGRGADLLLYIWVVITLALIVFLYLKVAHLSRKITLLARAVALAHPLLPAGEEQSPDGAMQ